MNPDTKKEWKSLFPDRDYGDKIHPPAWKDHEFLVMLALAIALLLILSFTAFYP